ncbi:MAG: glycosyltransferase [Anaerolineae bacterium]
MRRVLYFGTYDRAVGRNAILIDGLRSAGLEVVECHAPVWADTRAKLRAARGGWADLLALSRYAAAAPSLVRRHAAAGDYDALVVGSTGHIDLPLARRLATRSGKPLVFDPLVSVAETVRDRGLLAARSPRLGAIRAAERRLFALADLVIADTAPHADALATDMELPSDRFAVVPAGAPPEFRAAATPYAGAGRESNREPTLRVVYFGQYIPLHGLPTVMAAAARLLDRPDIRFELVGRGQELEAVRRLADELRLANASFTIGWLSPGQLANEHIAPADVCLGAFGAQRKAQLVVPFKVFTGLASGRAVVTGDTPAVAGALRRGEEVHVVPPADAAALAAALRVLADEPGRRLGLARAGQQAYDERFAPEKLGRLLVAALQAAERRARGNVAR